jgi:hypothetical protein
MRAGGLIGTVVALALAGCAGGPSSGGADPVAACGGFHIVVHNTGQADVAVSLNDQAVTTVAAGQSADIAEYGQYPAPAMPWDLKVTRAADGAVLLTAHLANDGSDARRVSVGDAPVDVSAYAC